MLRKTGNQFRKLLLVCVCTVILLAGHWAGAQVTEEWVVRYNGLGNGDDIANDLSVDIFGNIYVTGRSWGGDLTWDVYNTIKYNSNGDTIWVSYYDGFGNDDARSLAVDDPGNVYVTGRSEDQYATIKYNNSGVELWVSKYDALYAYQANALAVDDSGNVYVTGEGWISGPAIIKYNSNGDTVWVRRYNGDVASALAVDDSGNVYVTGDSWNGTNYDYATIKYNFNGDTLWLRRYNGPGNGDDRGSALAVDDSGYVYVTGMSYGGSGTGWDYATIKYSSSGNTLWVRRYNGPVNGLDIAYYLVVDSSGYVNVTGVSEGSATDLDYATIKYSSSGDTLWVRRYNGPGDTTDIVRALAVDGFGNVYVTGRSIGIGTSNDYATIKYNSSGDTDWVRRYNGPGNAWDEARAIAVDDSGNVYVTGSSWGNGTYLDYATIKYSQTVGVEEENAQIKMQNVKLLQNHPNPFHHSTVILYQIPSTNPESRNTIHVTLTVYDITGRLVESLVNESQEPGIYQVQWEGKNQASGIYFYRLTVGVQSASSGEPLQDGSSPYTATKKLILLR